MHAWQMGIQPGGQEDGDWDEARSDDWAQYEMSPTHADLDSTLEDRLAHMLTDSDGDSEADDDGSVDKALIRALHERLFADEADRPHDRGLSRHSIPSQESPHTGPHAGREYRDFSEHDEPDARELLHSFLDAKASGSTVMTSKQVNQMLNRFRMQEEKRNRKLLAKKREAESKEEAELRFHPQMNAKSRKISSQFPAFLERQASLQSYKTYVKDCFDQFGAGSVQHRDQELKANVRTPCICGAGDASGQDHRLDSPQGLSRASRAMRSPHHTASCQRFMDVCAKMNKKVAIQRKREHMRRSIDDMMSFHEEKRRRQLARAQIAQEREVMDVTFRPKINAKSERIFAEMVRQGKLDRDLSHRPQKTVKCSDLPKFKFQPTICKKSKRILEKKHRKSPNSQDISDLEDVFARLQYAQSATGVHHALPDEKEPMAAHEQSRPGATPNNWNVIQYDEKDHGFILQSFELPIAFG